MPLTEAQRQAGYRVRHQKPNPTSRSGRLVLTKDMLLKCHQQITSRETPNICIDDLTVAHYNLSELRSEVDSWLKNLPPNYEEIGENSDRVGEMETLSEELEEAIEKLFDLIDESRNFDLDDWLEELTQIVDNIDGMEVPRFRSR